MNQLQTNQQVRQLSSVPTRKVAAAGLSGAIAALIVFVLNTWNLLPGGADVPSDIAVAISTIIAFAVSYFVPPAASDTVVS